MWLLGFDICKVRGFDLHSENVNYIATSYIQIVLYNGLFFVNIRNIISRITLHKRK